MKDKDLRYKVASLANKLNNLAEQVGDLPEVRYCGVCKHRTLQECGRGGWEKEGDYLFWRKPYDWLCLTCGTKWECHNEEVCQKVK